MRIEEKRVPVFIASLMKKFRAGDKWVAWDVYEGPVTPKDLMSFKSMVAADKYCQIHSGDVGDEFYHFEYTPLENVLRSLLGHTEISKRKANVNELERQLGMHLLDAYHCDEPLINLLSDGIFHPVSRNQIILPWKEVISYLVVEHHYPDETACKFCYTSIIHGDYENYNDAVQCFNQLVEKFDKPGENNPEIKLIGKIKGQELDLDYDSYPQAGTGILFKLANASWNTGEKRYEVEHKCEPDKPVETYQHKMVRFNWRTSNLEFFDGALEKVFPDAKIDFMDFDRLSVRPVRITNPLIRAVSWYEHLQPLNSNVDGLRVHFSV